MFLKRLRQSLQPTDRTAALLARYRATGDVGVLGELYEPHMEMVYAVCYRYLRHEEDAKDAVMQLFEQLVVDLRRHDVEQFLPWLHRVAKNHCLMVLRRRQQQPALMLLDAVLADDDDVQPAASDESEAVEQQLTALENQLLQLPDEQRRCITLFYLEGKSYADVMNLTGYDMKQVKSYLQNGRRRLKNALIAS